MHLWTQHSTESNDVASKCDTSSSVADYYGELLKTLILQEQKTRYDKHDTKIVFTMLFVATC